MAKKSATFTFDKKKESEENVDKSLEMKATFTQRLFAFIVDAIILGFISTLIISFIPINDASKRLYEQQEEVIKDYTDKKITMDKYVNEMLDINYDISRQTYILSIVSIALSLCYYVIYPCYNNGQTLGKKLFKIRVKKLNDKDLSMNDLLIRAMINNSILYSILGVILVLFLKKDIYLGVTSLMGVTQYLVLFVSLLLIAFSKRSQGLHDLVVHTEVVMANTVKEEKLCQEGN